MSKLTALKDKDPKEVAKLLSAVAGTLLPTPTASNVISQMGNDPEFVEAILSEIRARLRVRKGDQSVKTQSQIYAFLSQEISEATLTREAINKVESRLGDRGDLHPSRYEIRFTGGALERIEATGNRRGNVIEAVTHPDQVVHLKAKYLSEEYDPRLTFSIKSVTTKRAEDRFILFVYSHRVGKFLYVAGAFRIYLSDVQVDDPSDPIDVVRSFANSFGANFQLGDKVSKFMLHETVALKHEPNKDDALRKDMKVLDALTGHHYGSVIISGKSVIRGGSNEVVIEVILGLMLDIDKYLAYLRRHHVNITPDEESLFHKRGFIGLSFKDIHS